MIHLLFWVRSIPSYAVVVFCGALVACSGQLSNAGDAWAGGEDTGRRADMGTVAEAGPHHDGGPGHDGGADRDGGTMDGSVDSGAPRTRDPLHQPFASSSIWNTPIGSGAIYVPANLRPVPGGGSTFAEPFSDTDEMAMTPTAPLVDVQASAAAWTGSSRCVADDPIVVLAQVHMPDDFIVPSSAFNEAFAFLGADGRTLLQGEPLARCVAGGPATSLVMAPMGDLYGDGILGGHGGSGMSSIGGTLRVGEMTHGQLGAPHAMKWTVYMGDAFRCGTTEACFRWPAPHADSYATTLYGSDPTNPNVTNFAFRMGALLALRPEVDIDSLGLLTEPGHQIAWTLQNYGAYVDEDAYGPALYIGTEHSPEGSFVEQFQTEYGFSFNQSSDSGSDWTHDFQVLLPLLAIIDNNGPDSIGGGGTPRQPLASEITAP